MNTNHLVFKMTNIIVGLFSLICFSTSISAANLPGLITPGGLDPSRQNSVQLPEQAPDYFPIPPMMERPLDIEEGPKVDIKEIKLIDIVEHKDISKKDLNEKVKKLLEQQKILASESNKQVVGITIGQIQFIADKITQLYRQKGYILAQAYLPPQKVKDGIVQIKIVEGKLGNVSVLGNEYYDKETYIKYFDENLNQAVNKYEMERLLLLINDFPGVGVTGSFKKGTTLGTSDLQLLTQSEDRFNGFVRYDNYGSEFTGDRRTMIGLGVNGLFNQINQLNVQFLKTHSPSNSDYYAINFEQLIYDEATYLGFAYNTNDYNIGRKLQSLGIEGDSEFAEIYLRRAFIKSRDKNLYGRFSLTTKEAVSNSDTGVELAKDELTVLTAQLNFDSIDERFSGINIFDISYSKGLGDTLGSMESSNAENSGRQGGSGKKAGADFEKWNLNFARVQSLPYNQSIIFKLNTQYSNDLLTSLEQFQLGGPNSVRAYPVSEFLSDKGYLTSIEWSVGLPFIGDYDAFSGKKWRDLFNLSFFYDSTKGWVNDPLSFQDESISLEGYGFAIQLKEINGFVGRFYMAKPIGNPEPSNDRDPQYYFEFSYNF
ncbi:MAG: hypothetical protein OQL19_12365 [Gammaproteobacteria bacterium]|nr:hypothetical protein [Gammaproteobacteria bacterium]